MYGCSQSDEACLFLFPDYCSKAIPYAAPHGRTERRSSDLPRQRHSFALTLHSLLTPSRNSCLTIPAAKFAHTACVVDCGPVNQKQSGGRNVGMGTRTLGTYSSHMPGKILTLERQERDETRNMAKQTGVHDVIDVIVPALMLPRLCQAASMCCTRMPSTRAARRLGRSWPCAGCAGVTRGASISDGWVPF